MGDLMAWLRRELASGVLHPLVLAATFHYRFVAIHPFDDANGRMARLLMNLILMQLGYVPIVIRLESRADYLLALEKADPGELADFVELVGEELIGSLELYLRAARRESLEEPGEFEQQVVRLHEQLASYET